MHHRAHVAIRRTRYIRRYTARIKTRQLAATKRRPVQSITMAVPHKGASRVRELTRVCATLLQIIFNKLSEIDSSPTCVASGRRAT